MTPKNIHLPCGSLARWDTESERDYRNEIVWMRIKNILTAL